MRILLIVYAIFVAIVIIYLTLQYFKLRKDVKEIQDNLRGLLETFAKG